MDASERWNFEDNTHNPEPSELGLCSPVFSFDNSIHNNTIGNPSGFSLDGPLIDLEEGWSKPLINEEWHAPPVYHHQQQQQHQHQHQHQQHHHNVHQHVNRSIYHEPMPSTSWAPYPVMQQHQVVHQQIHPSFHQHQVNHTVHIKSEAIVSPFTLDAQVAESINNNFHHSVSQCDSDSERSDRSGHSGHSDRTTGLSSSSQSSYLEHSPVSSHSERELADVLNSGLTAADLRRPRVQRKRRLTSSSIAEADVPLKPVAMMDEEEKRERNKQSASDYRKRRKNYVSDLENRLDAATSELSRKEEALRVALNEISSLKEQMSLFHSMAFKKEGQVSIPISSAPADQFNQGHKQRSGIQGMSNGRRVSGGKGAMSIAMLTLLSCLLCQFGFFDTTMGGSDLGFATTAPSMDGFADIAMSSYQAGAPDCSTGGCNKNRFLYWENDVQVDEVIDLDAEAAHINAVIDESPLVDLDVDAAIAQMQSVVNATEVETDWLGEGPRTPMGYLDADSYMEDVDRELSKSLNLEKTKLGKLDLTSMIASLFRWTSPGTA